MRVKGSIRIACGVLAIAALAACSKQEEEDAVPAANTEVAAPGATNASATAPAKDDVTTLDGSKFADFTGAAAAGEKVFIACKTCHAVEPGKNLTGPSLHGLLGRTSGTIPGYSYSTANKNSGIVWAPEKLFQYLENPQRVIPGTKMTYTGVKDPQQRADLIAYLTTLK